MTENGRPGGEGGTMEPAGIHVLIVDDMPESRELLKIGLSFLCLECQEANSGGAALAMLAEKEFAVVLVDVRMPGMDGFELVERMRGASRIKDTPVIFLTSAPPPESYVRRAYSLGAVDFLYSPFVPEVLRAKVSVFVDLYEKSRRLRLASEVLEEKVKERTADLEYQSALTRTVTDNATAGFLLLDAAGKIGYMNPAAERITGHASSEVRGRCFHDLARPARPDGSAYPAEADPIEQALRARSAFRNLEEIFIRKDRRFIYVSCSLTPLDRDGVSQGAVLEFIDITERKRIEAALRISEEKRLQSQKLEALVKLTAGIAHDFNNSLTAVNGYASLSLDLTAPGSDLHANLREILKAGERAARLTAQLLAFSGQQVLQSKIVDLNGLLLGMREVLERRTAGKSWLRFNLGQGLPAVRCDEAQLRQVVMHLFVNAMEAMPEGGEILIATSVADVAPDFPTHDPAGSPGPYAVLSVRDSGRGMDEKTRSRIFDPFYTTKSFGHNAGLGLAAVHGIVVQSGGHIAVESGTGRGSVFRVFLPSAKPDASMESSGHAEDAGPQKCRRTLLVAEPEAAIRKFLKTILVSRGFAVIEAEDGLSALGLSARHPDPIHLLITEMILPGLSGAALAEAFLQAHSGSRILFMSGHWDKVLVEDSLRPAGFFLSKPFQPEELLEAVDRALEGVMDSREEA
jgi:two-component system, cell cycle sensor histidine kinase and response regulator CckA